jgi:hypothetical protein
MAYLDDIIIYLNSKEKHKNILVIIKKNEFYIKKTNFIGFIIELK